MVVARYNVRLHTVSPIYDYRQEIDEIPTIHTEIEMERFISPLHDLRYFWRLYRLFRCERYSIVITFTTKPNIYGPLAARLAGIKQIVVAVRGMGRMFNEPSTYKELVMRALMACLYALACKASSTVWFTNHKDRDSFINWGFVSKNKCFLTRNAVDLTDYSIENISSYSLKKLRQELGITEDSIVIVMVARLIWSKGIGEFCDAARLLRSRLPNLHFLLVAPQESEGHNAVPLDYIRQTEASTNLKWLGFRKDVRELYALADIATLPSYYKEGGYPRALLEPMAYGKPVIAADTDDCKGPVINGENGFLVPPRNAQALADAIFTIASDEVLRRRFGEASLRRVQNEFDDKIVFEELINFLTRDF